MGERSRSNPSSLATCRSSRAGSGVVRIVGGKWRRSPLAVASRAGLRPTPERVRETVFDWLNHLLGSLEGLEALDLFAGSGAMGLEAASRGAARVRLIEKNGESAAKIDESVRRLKGEDRCSVVRGDAFELIRADAGLYDVIFIDPPYDALLQVKAAAAALERMKEEGLLYIERPEGSALDLTGLPLTCVRRGTAGQVVFELYARNGSFMAGQAKLHKEKLTKAQKAQLKRKEEAQ